MDRNIETGQGARLRKLERAHVDLIANVTKWLEEGGPVLSDEEKLERDEMQAEIAQLELQIQAGQEGYGRAIVAHSWRQSMLPGMEVVPVDPNEIPF